jgi:hypothetical protein
MIGLQPFNDGRWGVHFMSQPLGTLTNASPLYAFDLYGPNIHKKV